MEYYIWLQLCLSQGNRYITRIFEKFSSAKAVYECDNEKRLKLLPKSVCDKLDNSKLSDAKSILEKCKANDITVINYHNRNYPSVLREIDTPPLVLYVKGNLPDFESLPAICIVGPRSVSEFGKKSAYSLGFRLARAGFIVVSGGAVGSDTYAHIGALKAEGTTVLIMACGFSVSYLEENRALREHIAKSGCLISEYPPEYPANKYTFPVRNRIMSALSLGTVVIEAGEKSGALITAKHAYEQGRDVFVIPHSPKDKGFEGSNALLRDGAKPLLDTSDIFNEYIVRFPDKINIERAFSGKILPQSSKKTAIKSETQEKIEKNFNETLSKEAKIVYNYLDKQKFIPEDLIGTGLNSQQLISALTELEMEFLIKALPGGMYEKCN